MEGEPLFYVVQMPHQLSLTETSYWSGGVNSACRNLSPSSFKRLKSVMLETSVPTVLGPLFVALPKSPVKLRRKLSGTVIQIVKGQDWKDIKSENQDTTINVQFFGAVGSASMSLAGKKITCKHILPAKTKKTNNPLHRIYVWTVLM